LARNALLLVVLDVGDGGAGEGEPGGSPQFTPAWEAAMLAARRMSMRAGAGDAMVGMAMAMVNGGCGTLATRDTCSQFDG
jgi:hypothetical protein